MRSPNGAFSSRIAVASLSTGKDSPVKAASCTLKFAVITNRTSAGTTSPASINTKSPGTSSFAGTLISFPSRITFATGADNSFSALRDFSAFFCWITPMTALSITINKMTAESITSPKKAEMAAAASSTKIITSVICSKNNLPTLLGFLCLNSLSPCFCVALRTCSAERPCSVLCKASLVCSTVFVCHSSIPSTASYVCFFRRKKTFAPSRNKGLTLKS